MVVQLAAAFIAVSQTGQTVVGSVTSSQAVTEGIDVAENLGDANYATTPDTGGSIVIHKGGSTFNLDWNRATTTVQNVLDFLNNTAGLNATYDANASQLTVAGGPYTMYEVTNNGGPGFFDVNRVNITTTGTSYAGSVSSSAAVTEGIDTAATIASANFAGAKATQGTITVRKGGVTADLDWQKNLTTVQDVLNFLNANGVTASYDAHGDRLTVSGGPFELFDTNTPDGNGFFALNQISAGATGTAYTGTVTSSGNISGGIRLNDTLAANDFIAAPDSSGSIIVQRNGIAQALNWNAATTTVQNVLDFLNAQGLNASYDAERSKLTVTGNGQQYKLFEVTATGGPGFFAINNINVPTTGTPYAGSVTSSGAATAPPGIVLNQAINNNNYDQTSDVGGTIILKNSQGFNKQYRWLATDTVQSVLSKLNADSATSLLTFGFNSDNSKLVVTKHPTLGSYQLGEITDTGGLGWFDLHKIDATTKVDPIVKTEKPGS